MSRSDTSFNNPFLVNGGERRAFDVGQDVQFNFDSNPSRDATAISPIRQTPLEDALSRLGPEEEIRALPPKDTVVTETTNTHIIDDHVPMMDILAPDGIRTPLYALFHTDRGIMDVDNSVGPVERVGDDIVSGFGGKVGFDMKPVDTVTGTGTQAIPGETHRFNRVTEITEDGDGDGIHSLTLHGYLTTIYYQIKDKGFLSAEVVELGRVAKPMVAGMSLKEATKESIAAAWDATVKDCTRVHLNQLSAVSDEFGPSFVDSIKVEQIIEAESLVKRREAILRVPTLAGNVLAMQAELERAEFGAPAGFAGGDKDPSTFETVLSGIKDIVIVGGVAAIGYAFISRPTT